MCLYVDRSKHRRSAGKTLLPRTARQRIQVWKCLEIRNGRLVSPFQGTEYTLNEVQQSRLVKSRENQVGRGLHAYFCETTAREKAAFWGVHNMYIAYIPRGAKYFVGKNGDIASTKLVVTDKHPRWRYKL